jgi:hypothetical protein
MGDDCMTEAAIDSVLTAAPPSFSEDEAAALARELELESATIRR